MAKLGGNITTEVGTFVLSTRRRRLGKARPIATTHEICGCQRGWWACRIANLETAQSRLVACCRNLLALPSSPQMVLQQLGDRLAQPPISAAAAARSSLALPLWQLAFAACGGLPQLTSEWLQWNDASDGTVITSRWGHWKLRDSTTQSDNSIRPLSSAWHLCQHRSCQLPSNPAIFSCLLRRRIPNAPCWPRCFFSLRRDGS